MIKVDKRNLNFNFKLNLKKLIFFFKQKKKEINGKLDFFLFNKILCSFKISNPILQKSSYKIDILYCKLLYRIQNVNFNIKKTFFSLSA